MNSKNGITDPHFLHILSIPKVTQPKSDFAQNTFVQQTEKIEVNASGITASMVPAKMIF